MSLLTPNKIYEDFRNRRLNKSNASKLLMTLIEDPPDLSTKNQILCIKFLGFIRYNEEKVFEFLENLLVSDLNDLIRGSAAKVIINNFPDKAKKPIAWTLKHEKSNPCLILIIKILERASTPKLKSLLKIRDYVNFEGNIYFPSDFSSTINLNGKNIDSIIKIKGLDKLTNLKNIYLNFNQIAEINGFETLTNLKSLYLQHNKLSEISNIEHLRKLEYLYLNNNKISSLRSLGSLSNLKLLQVFDNQILEIEGIKKLSNLEILNLRNNRIKEIKGLSNVINLKRLDLSNNQITEIKGLESLTKLEFLDLSHNQITEVKGLEHLKKIKFLDLRNNRITQIKGLEKLRKLRYLYLGFNRIKNAGNFELLEHLKILDIKNAEESFIPDILRENYDPKVRSDYSLENRLAGIKDIKFRSISFNSTSLSEEKELVDDPLEYFTDSSWIIIWKNNEVEIFRISRLGNITWLIKNRRRN